KTILLVGWKLSKFFLYFIFKLFFNVWFAIYNSIFETLSITKSTESSDTTCLHLPFIEVKICQKLIFSDNLKRFFFAVICVIVFIILKNIIIFFQYMFNQVKAIIYKKLQLNDIEQCIKVFDLLSQLHE